MGYLLKNKTRRQAQQESLDDNGVSKAVAYRQVRLDNHTDRIPLEEVKSFLIDALSSKGHQGSTSSVSDLFTEGLSPHIYSQKALREIEASKQAIRKALGNAESMELYDRLVMTSSGAEAICQVHFSTYIEEMRLSGKNHILIPEGSPAAFCRSLERLEPLGIVTKFIKTGAHGICIDSFSELVSHRTALVSLCTADSLTGAIEPIEEIAKTCRSKHISLHVDITASIGKQWLDFEAIDADMITFCAKVLGAPFPMGALILKKGVSAAPFILGDKSQGGLRAGGQSTLFFKCLEIAVAKAMELQSHVAMEIGSLKKRMIDALGKNERFISFSSDTNALPNVCAFGFSGIKGELLAYALSKRGVFVSIGGGAHPNLQKLLETKGVDPFAAASAISISFTSETSSEDIAYATQVISEEVERLSALFPYTPTEPSNTDSEKGALL